jgi:hypothetical protein
MCTVFCASSFIFAPIIVVVIFGRRRRFRRPFGKRSRRPAPSLILTKNRRLAKNRRFNYIASSSNANRPFGSGDGTRRLLCYRRFVFASCLNRTSTQITRFFRFYRRPSLTNAHNPTFIPLRAAASERLRRFPKERRPKKFFLKKKKTPQKNDLFFSLKPRRREKAFSKKR